MHVDLVISDFDGVLYRSPSSPTGDPAWVYHAKSLAGWERPGFDRRWNLELLAKLRTASNRDAMLALLTGRPDHAPMRTIIRKMAHSTGLTWNSIQLKPAYLGKTDAEYKATIVRGWLSQVPTLRTVTAYDDDPENLESMQRAVEDAGRSFVGHLILPPPPS